MGAKRDQADVGPEQEARKEAGSQLQGKAKPVPAAMAPKPGPRHGAG